MTRISLAALVVMLGAGVYIGSALSSADDATPEPRRTAYVDFLKLLKNDQPLARRQLTIASEMQKDQDSIDSTWDARIQQHKRVREQNKPNTKAYRDAMLAQLDAEKQRYQEKLLSEQVYQEELRNYGIERFKALKTLTSDIAKQRGYNEVLNIVNIDDVANTRDDFQALQQQLLVSPVLYHDPEHNLTEVIKAAAKAMWDEHITLSEFDKEKKTGGIEFTVDGEATALTRNAEGEIEIKLGQKGAFKVAVFDKLQPAAGARAEVRFYKRGFAIGEFNENGTYTAPDAIPAGGATFEVTVRSAIDPTVEQKVTIRLK